MKAIVLRANGVLEAEERVIPSLSEGEYLLKIAAAGICNSDIFRAFSHEAYFYPIVLGHEFCGRIAACGPQATKFRKGQWVTIFPLLPCGACPACAAKQWVYCSNYSYYGSRCDGAFQEYLPVKEWNVIPLSEGTDPAVGSLCEPLAVSVRAANVLVSGPLDEEVAIIGGGFIGLAAAMIISKRLSSRCKITLIDRNQFKLDIARGLGFSTMLFDEASCVNNRYGYLLEACGGIEAYHMAVRMARPQAKIVLVGNIQGDIEFKKQEFSSILRKELFLRGVWNSHYQGGFNDNWHEAIDLMKTTKDLGKLITRRISLGEIPDVLHEMYRIKKNHKPHHMLKVIVCSKA